MKCLALVLLAATLRSALCAAQSACADAAVMVNVEAAGEQLNLADLLAPEACPGLRKAAARISLGAVPRGKLERVLDGQQVRGIFADLAGGNRELAELAGIAIPQRIAVQHAGAKKSCAEAALLVAGGNRQWQEEMDCSGLPRIPEDTPLEITRNFWDAALRRWEFSLRCAQPLDCVPFLLWVRPGQAASALSPGFSAPTLEPSPPPAPAQTLASPPLIQRGQTAILTWADAGIRIVAPVLCLDAGRLGDLVRVRFKDGQRILRAEVMGSGRVRVGP
jgi:hypothetical protein